MIALPEPSSLETTYHFPTGGGPVVSYRGGNYRVLRVIVTDFLNDEPSQVNAWGIPLTAKGEPDRRAGQGPLYSAELERMVLEAHNDPVLGRVNGG